MQYSINYNIRGGTRNFKKKRKQAKIKLFAAEIPNTNVNRKNKSSSKNTINKYI